MEALISSYHELRLVPLSILCVTLEIAKGLLTDIENGVDLTRDGKDGVTAQIIRMHAGNRDYIQTLVICIQVAMFEHYSASVMSVAGGDEGLEVWQPA